MERGKCRSCSATVLWATTAKGKAQPLDERPERRIINAIMPPASAKMERRIGVVYDPASAEHRAFVVETWPRVEGVVGTEVEVYMPHHATCPNWVRKR